MSLLLLPVTGKYYWHLSARALIIIICITAPKLIRIYNYVSISPWCAIDTISASLTILTLWVTALIIIASYKIFNSGSIPKYFVTTTLALLITLILCFCASNIVQFYIWFEVSLIPTIFLIMLWGYQPERTQARIYLIIYTVVASLPLLVIVLRVYYASSHILISYPWINFPERLAPILMWAIILTAFIVKLPLFSVHLWLPKAHVEAPVAGSIILAAILLKLGGYGLIRFILLFKEINHLLYAPISSISLVGAVITRLICIRQSDLKSLIAYSSVGHIGLLITGALSNTSWGLFGALIIIIAHGICSSALFCMANITYELTNTRSVALTKGLLAVLPIISMWWFILSCANMAAPPSINLIREILLITATMSHSNWLMIPLALIRFLSAAYSLHLYSSVNHGHALLLTNPLPTLKSSYNLLIILHVTPILGLILTPDIISNI